MPHDFTIGFMPLVDACLPILALENGFAEEEGVALRLVRDMSWATVLDRLLYGHTDAAHLVAPLAIAATLGRGRPAQALAVPMVLGLNGNAITMHPDLAARVCPPGQLGDPVAVGKALRSVVDERLAMGSPLRFGVVHRHSSHNLIVRDWLSACGIRPDHDIEIATIAPPFCADALEQGDVDAICVGEPWNSVAVERGVGTIVLATAQIWQRGVEKVLAMREPVLNERREAVEALVRALVRAAAHFVDPAHHDANAEVLARSAYLDGNQALVRRAIADHMVLARGGTPIHFPDFMLQHRDAAGLPSVSQAQALYAQMARWDPIEPGATDAASAAGVFRPDVYRSALAHIGISIPAADPPA